MARDFNAQTLKVIAGLDCIFKKKNTPVIKYKSSVGKSVSFCSINTMVSQHTVSCLSFYGDQTAGPLEFGGVTPETCLCPFMTATVLNKGPDNFGITEP